jgi:hypothetical protein
MTDHLLNLDIQNDRALARAEAASLIPPEDLGQIRNPFAPPLHDEDDMGEIRTRGMG